MHPIVDTRAPPMHTTQLSHYVKPHFYPRCTCHFRATITLRFDRLLDVLNNENYVKINHRIVEKTTTLATALPSLLNKMQAMLASSKKQGV